MVYSQFWVSSHYRDGSCYWVNKKVCDFTEVITKKQKIGYNIYWRRRFIMEQIDELFWNSSVDEIKQGYVYDSTLKQYICLICGKSFTKGVIYSSEDILLEAEKTINVHITNEHNSMFEYLLNMDKKLTGLTDIQKNLLNYFYKGYNDKEIVAEFDGGSTSTIRNHRFNLRQKEKQAKIFLAIMELLNKNKSSRIQEFIKIHKSATMVDDRYAITDEENEKILKKYFIVGFDGPLSEFPLKEKRKLVVLRNIIKRFDHTKKYTEKEINTILKGVHSDYVTLRRYLIEYGFMDRVRDGSLYWVKD